jgi:hypothetical protein
MTNKLDINVNCMYKLVNLVKKNRNWVTIKTYMIFIYIGIVLKHFDDYGFFVSLTMKGRQPRAKF